MSEHGDNAYNNANEHVSDLLHNAHRDIDAAFGEGYAARNPILLAAWMRAHSSEVQNQLLLYICEQLPNLIEACRSDHPLMGETLGGLSEIAEALRT
ncbi:MAG: hypothetical protein AAGF47_05620 [Planctomycetota bacterium]